MSPDVDPLLLMLARYAATERGWHTFTTIEPPEIEEQAPAGDPLVVIAPYGLELQHARALAAIAGAGRHAVVLSAVPLSAEVSNWLPAGLVVEPSEDVEAATSSGTEAVPPPSGDTAYLPDRSLPDPAVSARPSYGQAVRDFDATAPVFFALNAGVGDQFEGLLQESMVFVAADRIRESTPFDLPGIEAVAGLLDEPRNHEMQWRTDDDGGRASAYVYPTSPLGRIAPCSVGQVQDGLRRYVRLVSNVGLVPIGSQQSSDFRCAAAWPLIKMETAYVQTVGLLDESTHTLLQPELLPFSDPEWMRQPELSVSSGWWPMGFPGPGGRRVAVLERFMAEDLALLWLGWDIPVAGEVPPILRMLVFGRFALPALGDVVLENREIGSELGIVSWEPPSV